MSLLLFFVTAANLCLCLTFASLFSAFAQMIPAALAALVLGASSCACGSLAARKNPNLRFLFLLLPPLALLLTRSWIQALLLAPALLYPAAVLISGRFKISYHDYRGHFLGSSGVITPLIFIGQFSESSFPPLIFGTASLILGVFCLRQLRYGELTSRKQKSLELLSLCALPAGAGLAVFLLPKALKAGEWLIKSVLFPLIQLLQKLVEIIIRWLEPVIDSARETPATTVAVESTTVATSAYEPETVSADFPVRIRENLPVVLIPLAIAAGILILVLLVRRLWETRSRQDLPETEMPEAEADPGIPRTSAKTEQRANRRKVRRIYEKYLKLLQRRQFRRKPQDSSREILEKSRDLSAEEPARALRELYILARYNPKAVVTDAQVQEAQRLLKELREK